MRSTPLARRAGAVVTAAARGNRALSRRLADRLAIPDDKPFWQRFDRQVAERARGLPAGALAVDVGGGRRCTFAHAVPRERAVRLMSVDISAAELAANEVADQTVLGDIRALPLPDACADLVVSRTLLEHVDGNRVAAAELARILKPGATTLHFVPCRYSLFATAARLLPFGPLLGLLHLVDPSTRGQVEFDVHYDDCLPAAMERNFRDAGFRDVQVAVCYEQNDYFTSVFPLFVLVCAYQAVVRRLGLRRLGAYMIVAGRR